MNYPMPLQSGDTIGLCGPAFPVTSEQLKKSVQALQDFGFQVKVGDALLHACAAFDRIAAYRKRKEEGSLQNASPARDSEGQCEDEEKLLFAREEYETDPALHCYLETGYLCGIPQARAAEINGMFADPEVKGLIAVRGGYGTSQVMPYLDYNLMRHNPKAFCGFSDLTCLVNAIPALCGYAAYHAPMPCTYMIDEKNPFAGYSEDSFRQTVCSDWQEIRFRNFADEPIETVCGGKAEGRLFGGNVTVFARTTGTFYHPNTEGTILFFEDVEEAVASLDMYITQMKNADVFRGVKGILLGCWNGCVNKYNMQFSAEKLVRNRFSELGVPVLANLRVGHRKPSATLPIGAMCRMDADTGEIVFYKD